MGGSEPFLSRLLSLIDHHLLGVSLRDDVLWTFSRLESQGRQTSGRKGTIYSIRLHRVPLPRDQDPELFAM